MNNSVSVAIIGAGASGIAACRALQQQNIEYVCFEKGSKIGGLWRFNNDNGQSSAYRSLHINTSKRKMEYDDFPMPDTYPDYPHHEQIIDYFENYVAHFDLARHIRCNQEVTAAEEEAHGWKLSFADGTVRNFTHLIVANGHHWQPKWPDPKPPGDFAGTELHSHYYVDPSDPVDLIDKRVVVVGMGNSAMDIACELGRKGVARSVFLSARSGVYIMPKYFGSKVLDHNLRHPAASPPLWERLLHLLPRSTRLRLFNATIERQIRQTVGEPQTFGLPKPQGRFHQNHPTISPEIHIRLGSGDVRPKPAIESTRGNEVKFVDGSSEDVDAILYCTGYHIRFPFLARNIIDPVDNKVVLYKRIFDPDHPRVFFIGLVQPLCALMPIAQLQSRLVAACLTGQVQLPDAARMRTIMHREYDQTRATYLRSSRHTVQIDCLEYSWELNRLLRKFRQQKAG